MESMPPNPAEEPEIIALTGNAASLAAHRRSFEDVARRELATLYRVARRLARNAQDAEDLVGQTLQRAFAGWATFDGRFPRSWMLRILQNCHFRNASKRMEATVDDADLAETAHAPECWNAIDWKLMEPVLSEAVNRLPEVYRLAIVLCDIEELTYDEAAAAMETPVGTVRSRVFRGRALLRQWLAGHLPEERRDV